MKELIGDYETFFEDIYNQLQELGVVIDSSFTMSHLGVRTVTFEEYKHLRDEILKHCSSYVENEHNGRPISKLVLTEPLVLPHGFTVDLIELMPPKPNVPYPSGLEHCGVVVGEKLEEFATLNKKIISGRQDQGPYCQPYLIDVNNGKRVKFYDISLRDVVEKEGYTFKSVN